jgi:predicted lipoprotein with Yx(FWY)xxD motif
MRRVLASILVSTGLFMAACSSGSNTSAGSATTTTSPATTTSSASSPSTTGAAAANATVSVATDAKFGQILVDSQGRTVYIFDKDTGTTSACTGGCASVWPAVTATGTPQGGSGVDASKLASAMGQVAGQVTYNGHLLYRYVGDSKAGDVNGAAIPGWHPVTASGAAASA